MAKAYDILKRPPLIMRRPLNDKYEPRTTANYYNAYPTGKRLHDLF